MPFTSFDSDVVVATGGAGAAVLPSFSSFSTAFGTCGPCSTDLVQPYTGMAFDPAYMMGKYDFPLWGMPSACGGTGITAVGAGYLAERSMYVPQFIPTNAAGCNNAGGPGLLCGNITAKIESISGDIEKAVLNGRFQFHDFCGPLPSCLMVDTLSQPLQLSPAEQTVLNKGSGRTMCYSCWFAPL